MQTCSICNSISPDTSLNCKNCNADLHKNSTSAVALRRMQANSRVTAVRISVAGNACPLCYESRGTFPKENTPRLPHEGCSHQHGCRCFYEPVLGDLFP